MSTISTVGKVAYVYQESTDTWHPVAGSTNTAAPYVWTGDHTFDEGSNVSFEEVVLAKAGVNNFLNPSARDTALGSSPSVDGIVVFVRQDADGNSINQVQYSNNGTWKNAVGQTELKQVASSTSYSLIQSDAGKTLELSPNSGITMTVQIPTEASAGWVKGQRLELIRVGEGIVTVSPSSGVTLNSKNNNRQISAQWSAAMLYYRGSNSWVLLGDLTASA
jgi:hypothetical protein